MYLSRIQLNPARREARRFLESPHVLHAAVLAAFPDPSARVTGRVLSTTSPTCTRPS
jgi:CRISPR system Cascade subunit CasE